MDPRFAFGLEAPYIRPTEDRNITVFQPKQLAILREGMSGSRRNRLIYGLLLGTGVCVGELSGLELQDMEELMLHVRRGKGRKDRRVPMSGQLREQYLAIRYSERLAEAGAVPSVGSRGDSYDNALAETVIGLYKMELIRRRGPWRTAEQVEAAAAEWVDWWNRRRLHGAAAPSEFEQRYYDQRATIDVA